MMIGVGNSRCMRWGEPVFPETSSFESKTGRRSNGAASLEVAGLNYMLQMKKKDLFFQKHAEYRFAMRFEISGREGSAHGIRPVVLGLNLTSLSTGWGYAVHHQAS